MSISAGPKIATAGNPAKTTSAGYNEWTIATSTNTLPAYVWVRE